MMKIFCSAILILCGVAPMGGAADEFRTFVISSVSEKKAVVSLENENGRPLKLPIGELYDVYERAVEVDGRKLLVDFCGSVYLEKITENSLEFFYTWTEEANYVKAGFILASTGRTFSVDKEDLIKIMSENSNATPPKEETLPVERSIFQAMLMAGGSVDMPIAFFLSDSTSEPTFGLRGEVRAFMFSSLGIVFKFDSGTDFSSFNCDLGIDLYFSLRTSSAFVFLVYFEVGIGMYSTNEQLSSGELSDAYGEAGLLFNLPFQGFNFGRHLYAGVYVGVYPYETESEASQKTSIGFKIGYGIF